MPQKEVATNDSHCFSRNNIIQTCYRFSDLRSMRINLFFKLFCMRYERLLNLLLHGGGGGGACKVSCNTQIVPFISLTYKSTLELTNIKNNIKSNDSFHIHYSQ